MPEQNDKEKLPQGLFSVITKLIWVIIVLVLGLVSLPIVFNYINHPSKSKDQAVDIVAKTDSIKKDNALYWLAPDVNSISDAGQKEQIEYGKELIAHTAKYLGPNGSVLQISNGMNCQNCHLHAGTGIFANNYGSVASLYPKFRARSGSVENIYKRVNDCLERSLNGKGLDSAGKEMQAIVAYINFLGTNVPKGKKAEGSGFKDLSFLDRAADPAKGQAIYSSKCQSCHQPDGEGLYTTNKTEFTYPPLWGQNSFNDGAGLYRLSNLAKYVKYNMPQGTTYESPQLSDEEAWDVAAFIATQERPHISFPKDWPDKSKKPVDHPFGPYADDFSQIQHKLGPFKPIIESEKQKENAKKIKGIASVKR